MAQPIVDWSRNYGGSENDFAYDIKQTNDDGFIVAGATFSNDDDVANNNGMYDAWIIKLNEIGAVEWEQNFGGTAYDIAKSILQTNDGGFIFTGYTHSNDQQVNNNNGEADVWVVKTDANGQLQWEQTYGGARSDLANSIIETSDGGYIIAGQTNSNDVNVGGNYGSIDFWVLKIGEDGSEEWNSTYGGANIDKANSIQQTPDGGYIVAGTSLSFNEHGNGFNALNDAWVIKLSQNGNLLWSNNYGTDSHDIASKIISSNDGGYIVTGTFSSTDGSTGSNNGKYDEGYWLFKIDGNGNTIWEKVYSGEKFDVATDITPAQDGGYILAGYSSSEGFDVGGNNGNRDYWIVKVNSEGDQDWEQHYGGSENDEAQAIFSTNDGFVLAGHSLSDDDDVPDNRGHYDLWVMRMSLVLPLSVSLGDDINVCENETIELVPSIGFCADCSFEWNDGNTDEIREITPTEDISYSVTVTSAAGISASDGININVIAPPVLSYEATNLSCNGVANGSINLTANGEGGNFDYEWESGQSTEDLDGLTAGEYRVTVSNDFNCESVLEVSIVEPTAITLTVNNTNNVTCNGLDNASINLLANGGTGNLSYEWNTGDSGPSISSLNASTYQVTITDENECKLEEEFIVTEPEVLSIDFDIVPTSCSDLNSGAINLDVEGGTGNYNYEWSNDATSQDLENLAAGTYWITLSDANNCELFGSYVVDATENLFIEETVSDISCNGADNGSINLDIQGGDGNYIYTWSNGESESQLSGLEPGTYDVLVTDGSECEGEATFIIIEPTAIDIDLVMTTDVLCNGNNTGAIDINVDGGVGNYTYDWNIANDNQDLTNITAGEYTITVRDENECAATQSYMVNEPDAIEIDQDVTQVTCNGANNASIDITVTGGTGAYNYEWSNDVTTQDLSNLEVGEYSLFLTDENDCSVVTTIQILEPSPLDLVATTTTPQNGDDGQISVAPNGGTPPYSVVWEDGTTGVILSNIGVGEYDVTITDANDCVYQETINLGVVGIDEIENLQTFNLSPNPTNDIVNLLIDFDQRQDFELVVYNELGQVIQKFVDYSKEVSMSLDLSNQASGLYFFVLTTNEGIATKKLVLTGK